MRKDKIERFLRNAVAASMPVQIERPDGFLIRGPVEAIRESCFVIRRPSGQRTELAYGEVEWIGFDGLDT